PAPVARAASVDTGAHRVERAEQSRRQQCGAEDRQLDCPGVVVVNFDGHFVTRLSRSPTKVPFCSLPVTITSRPSAKGSGTVPAYVTGIGSLPSRAETRKSSWSPEW